MSNEEGSDQLYAVLVALTNRKLTMSEVHDAVGLKSSQYSELRKSGELVTADRVLRAARHFDINPVGVLAECGLILPREVTAYVAEKQREYDDLFGPPGIHPFTATRREVKTVGRRLADMPVRDDAPSI